MSDHCYTLYYISDTMNQNSIILHLVNGCQELISENKDEEPCRCGSLGDLSPLSVSLLLQSSARLASPQPCGESGQAHSPPPV